MILYYNLPSWVYFDLVAEQVPKLLLILMPWLGHVQPLRYIHRLWRTIVRTAVDIRVLGYLMALLQIYRCIHPLEFPHDSNSQAVLYCGDMTCGLEPPESYQTSMWWNATPEYMPAWELEMCTDEWRVPIWFWCLLLPPLARMGSRGLALLLKSRKGYCGENATAPETERTVGAEALKQNNQDPERAQEPKDY